MFQMLKFNYLKLMNELVDMTSNINAGESVTINLNGEISQLNLIEKEDAIITNQQHDTIKPNYVNVALVAGVGALLSSTPALSSQGSFGLQAQSFSLNRPLTAQALGFLSSKPLLLIPDSFYTNNATNSSTNTTILNTVSGNINAHLININYEK